MVNGSRDSTWTLLNIFCYNTFDFERLASDHERLLGAGFNHPGAPESLPFVDEVSPLAAPALGCNQEGSEDDAEVQPGQCCSPASEELDAGKGSLN